MMMEAEATTSAKQQERENPTEVDHDRVRITSEKAKDPKKVAAGHAGAAVQKAKHERLLEQLRAAKATADQSASATEELRERENAVKAPDVKHAAVAEHRNEPDWTPWIIGEACLAAGAPFCCETTVSSALGA